MTGVITWVVDYGDGVCIEREQPSTAFKPMPAYGALNSSFTTKPNLDKPEADGYMKLGDIKGEFAGAYESSIGGFQAHALTNRGQKFDLDVGPVNQGANVWTTGPVTGFKADDMVSETWLTDGSLEGYRNGSVTQEVGWWTVDGADFRGIHQDALSRGSQGGEEAGDSFVEPPVLKQVSNWDAICDVGTAIKQTSVADALINYHPVDAHQMGELRSDHIGAFKTLNETTNFRPQQGANTSIVHLEHDAADTAQIGALKPSHVRSVAASADNDSIVYLEEDAIVGNTGANPFSELDQGFVAAPVNEIRSENRFVIEPINLFQGLDAGGMNYAEAIGMDSSTVGVMNNVISSLQPANEIF